MSDERYTYNENRGELRTPNGTVIGCADYLATECAKLVRLANLGLTVAPTEPDYQWIANQTFVIDQRIPGHMPGHSLGLAVQAVLAAKAQWDKDNGR